MLITILDTVYGDILTLNLSEVLKIINSDRSDEWTNYDENDWEEGLKEFTDYKVLKIENKGK